ncbi:MAG: serine/threonine-protein kinase, partial [Planctomycetaceae bacterium]
MQPGAHFLGFDLVAELGRGAVGRVYLARQRHLANRRVVLKVTTEPTVEPVRLASLQHTNVVPIYSFHRSSALHVVCMPYLGSCVLKQWVDHLRENPGIPRDQSRFVTTLAKLSGSTIPQASREVRPAGAGPLPADAAPLAGELPQSGLFRLRGENYPAAVLWLGARLAEGLAHAHEKGVLHLDIKPGNILLTDFGQPMLLDFHLARSSRAGSPGSRQVGGTIPYMGPEHLRCLVEESDIDPRADIYSLGVVLFEMLTGQLPFPAHHGGLAQILPRLLADRQQVVGLRHLNPQVSPATEAIVQRCLHPDPNQRYQSAEQLLEDLEAQIRHRPLRYAGNPSWQEGLSKWARRHPRVTSAGGIALIASSVVLLLISGLLARDYRVKTLEARQVADTFEDEAPLFKSALAMSALEPAERSRDIARTETALVELGLLSQLSDGQSQPGNNSSRAFSAVGSASNRPPTDGEFPARPATLDWATQRPFALLEPAQRDRLAKVASEVLFALAATQEAEAVRLIPAGQKPSHPVAQADPVAQGDSVALGNAFAQGRSGASHTLTLNLDSGECFDGLEREARARALCYQALANNTRAIQYCSAVHVPVAMWRQRSSLLYRLSQAETAREVRELAERASQEASPDQPLEALEHLTKSGYLEAGRLF